MKYNYFCIRTTRDGLFNGYYPLFYLHQDIFVIECMHALRMCRFKLLDIEINSHESVQSFVSGLYSIFYVLYYELPRVHEEGFIVLCVLFADRAIKVVSSICTRKWQNAAYRLREARKGISSIWSYFHAWTI